MNPKVVLVECPRDAMQGWKGLISTDQKVAYINALLRVGFDTIDFGSFVSPRAIPQMADTKEVIEGLSQGDSKSKLLAIVANVRGAEEAARHHAISLLGFPFSVSETFQQRNANSSVEEAFDRVKEIREITAKANQGLVVYLSMGFGNPYGDDYSEDIVSEWAERIRQLDVDLISVADTIGIAEPVAISRLCKALINAVGAEKFGLHLHSTPDTWQEKVAAGWEAGCRRFDGAILGIGGCPMASDTLTGNIDMGNMIEYFDSIGALPNLDLGALDECVSIARTVFVV